MQYPAVFVALPLAAGTAAGVFCHLPAHPLALVAIWLSALGAFVARRDTLTIFLTACGFMACGAALGSRAEQESRANPLQRFFSAHIHPGDHQLAGTITGRLRADGVRGPSGLTLDVDVEAVDVDGVVYAAPGGALIGVGGALESGQIPQWRRGRRVAFPATLRRPTRYLNRGVPDAERTLAWRGTSLVGTIKSDRLVTVVEDGTWPAEAAASVRAAVRRGIASSVSRWSQRSAAMVAAILIGDRAGLEEAVERKLQEAGTYHVIAISGGNIAILAALCLFVFRVLWIGPRVASVLIVAILTGYAAVVEGGSSVARATLMAAIYVAVRMGDHQTAAINVAGLAAAILFFAAPLHIVDAGFALTFGATLGIIIGASALAGTIAVPRWLKPAAALLAASLCAEIALLPVSAFVFSRITFAGLLVNFAAIPLMTIVQIAGMAAVALAWTLADLAPAAGWVAHGAVEGLIRSAALVDAMPWLTRRVAPPHPVVMAAYYVSLIAAVTTPRLRTALVTVAAAAWMVAAPGTLVRGRESPLRVTFLDVGQGDAALVEFPNGRSLVIDAGGLPGARFDIGGRVVSPALWALGVRRLDYMSITHGDDDHIGGAASVFRDFRPFEVWEGVPVPPHEPSQRLRALADDSGTPWRTLQPADRLSLGEVDLLVHHPPPADWERQRVRNDDSAVIEIRYKGVSFVFTGDIGRGTEQQIAPSFSRAPIRVLKVPHHGSATSSSQLFLTALRPDIAVISAGRGNPFGHPVANVLERYRAIGTAIFRTDQDGAVTIETDGTTVRVSAFTGRLLTLTTHGR